MFFQHAKRVGAWVTVGLCRNSHQPTLLMPSPVREKRNEIPPPLSPPSLIFYLEREAETLCPGGENMSTKAFSEQSYFGFEILV